jgi:hypothetical protein
VRAFAQAAYIVLACLCAIYDGFGHDIPEGIVTLCQVKLAAYILKRGRHHGYMFGTECCVFQKTVDRHR